MQFAAFWLSQQLLEGQADHQILLTGTLKYGRSRVAVQCGGELWCLRSRAAGSK